jgi:hypothetical protein
MACDRLLGLKTSLNSLNRSATCDCSISNVLMTGVPSPNVISPVNVGSTSTVFSDNHLIMVRQSLPPNSSMNLKLTFVESTTA